MCAYRVMQVCETGEVCRANDRSFSEYEDASNWVTVNADNYPESTFFIEEEVNYYNMNNWFSDEYEERDYLSEEY